MPSGLNLRDDVLNSGVCALCGACLDWCPYILNLEDHLALRFDCPIQDGRCYAICPRTFTDWPEMSQKYIGADNHDQGIGSFKQVYRVKAKAGEKSRQDGGTVSVLVQSALNRQNAMAALVTGAHDLEPIPALAHTAEAVVKSAGSKFLATPSLRKIIEAQNQSLESLLVVGRPCQIQALRKMQHSGYWHNYMGLTSVGLFCMWSLDWSFKDDLEAKYNSIVKLSIPQHGLEIKTQDQTVLMSTEEVRAYIRSGCNYCIDMTAELADISVGTFEPEAGWNTVIVRTAKGAALLEQCRELLDIEEYPQAEFRRLQNASLTKKKRSLQAIAGAVAAGSLKQGFLDLDHPLYRNLLNQAEEVQR